MDENNVQRQPQAINEFDGEKPLKNESCALPMDKRICLVGEVVDDSAACKAAQTFGVPVITSETGLEFIEDESCVTVYILDKFEGPLYEAIHKSNHKILGKTALKQIAELKEPLPDNTRPLYNLSMRGVVVCFTGFRKKEELTRMIPLIHHMGGSIRKEMALKVTHLIANVSGGDKYQYAFVFRVPVMSASWVQAAWDNRSDVIFKATEQDFQEVHKLQPFYGTKVCFVGFSTEETQHMKEVLEANGGTLTDVDDPLCNYVVVDESAVVERPEINSRAYIVKAEWFWASVQKAACVDGKDYLFDTFLEKLNTPSRQESNVILTPSSAPGGSARRKRKRLHGTLGQLVRGASITAGAESPGLHGKRRSSVSDAGLLSVSGSFLDCTTSPDKSLLDEPEGVDQQKTSVKKLSPRQMVFIELVQTESNYVNILDTIMTMFKSHLEKMSKEEALLNHTELKIIFGNLPPIYETHKSMLEELRNASLNWTEDTSVGNIILKYAKDLTKAYPPFVNYFETMKDMLVQCDTNKPRFHAFLKVCQTKPECGRQSLQELLIRPVQRLPSISLLLGDILKHTSKNNPDHSALEKALAAIREVMTHINEDKRKTEGQLVMFDVFNEIDNCPPHLVSSHRSFVSRCEVQELSDGLSGRGDMLVLFLFTDMLEVCKKRSKYNSLKSPNTINGHAKVNSSIKPYKHVRLMPLSTIKQVINIRESDECHNGFALRCRNNQELKEKIFSFITTDEDVIKLTFLRMLCRQMANTVCQADAETFLVTQDSQELDIDTSDIALGTFSKAFKFANRTRMKVGRAFSFNKTPSKLKRAVSTMMSPFGSSTNLTPASQLAQMRLASCNNINELGNNGTSESSANNELLVAPMSVQPTRKTKCTSLGAAALRRL